MGKDEAALLRLWREKRGEVGAAGPLRQPHRPAWPRDRGPQSALVRGQYRPDHHGHPAAGSASGNALDGRHPRWARSRAAGRYSRPNSCCRGRSRKRRPPKNTCRSCSTTCGWSTSRAAVLSVITGGGKWVEINTHADPLYQHLVAHRREEILALRGDRRAAAPVRGRAAAAADRGDPDCRHEFIECMGGIRRHLWADPGRASRA